MVATKNSLSATHHRNYRIAIGLLVVLIVITGMSTYFLRRDRQASDKRLAAEKPAITTTEAKNNDEQKEPKSSNKEATPELKEDDSTSSVAPIAFVDTNGWKQVSSKDGKYSVSVSEYVTHGACKENSSVLLIGMIYLDMSTGEYSCDSITSALTASNPQLTRIAFGMNADTSKPDGASASTAILANGVGASRYEYVTTEKGEKYNNIKYVATKGGSQFVAHMRWLVSYNIYGGSDAFTSPPVFDTIVQKTWNF